MPSIGNSDTQVASWKLGNKDMGIRKNYISKANLDKYEQTV